MKSRLLFLASLWMAISVALLSALAPIGPPSSRLTGSAFNPATTGVVLKARSPQSTAEVRAAEPDGERRALPTIPALQWLLPLMALLLSSWLLQRPAAFTRTRRSRTRGAIRSPKRARAPPFSF